MKHTYPRLFLCFLLLLTVPAFSQGGFGLPPGFDLKTFQKNEEQAMYFLQYDSAWQFVSAFDHLPASKEYICYQDKRGWKVVAGTIDSSGFKSDAVYYTVDNKHVVTVARKKFDTVQVTAMAHAYYNAGKALAKLNIKSSAGWHKFVRVNLDQSITVWAFPEADASGAIWYGPECSWYYSPNGTQLMTSKIVNKAPQMAGKAANALNMNCPTDKMPTVGTIWLAHKYKKSYSDINISYKTGTSTLRFNEAEKTYAWEHVAN